MVPVIVDTCNKSSKAMWYGIGQSTQIIGKEREGPGAKHPAAESQSMQVKLDNPIRPCLTVLNGQRQQANGKSN